MCNVTDNGGKKNRQAGKLLSRIQTLLRAIWSLLPGH